MKEWQVYSIMFLFVHLIFILVLKNHLFQYFYFLWRFVLVHHSVKIYFLPIILISRPFMFHLGFHTKYFLLLRLFLTVFLSLVHDYCSQLMSAKYNKVKLCSENHEVLYFSWYDQFSWRAKLKLLNCYSQYNIHSSRNHYHRI